MTRFLLDTHAALFWWSASAKLGEAARQAISSDDATIFVSAASGWEVATKFRNGKLGFAGDPGSTFPRLMIENDFKELPVDIAHALHAGSLPGKHRDPFDRIIAAQALIEQLVVVTRDPQIAAFGCKVLW